MKGERECGSEGEVFIMEGEMEAKGERVRDRRGIEIG